MHGLVPGFVKKAHVLSLRASITSDLPLNKKQTNCKGCLPTPSCWDHLAIEIGHGFQRWGICRGIIKYFGTRPLGSTQTNASCLNLFRHVKK